MQNKPVEEKNNRIYLNAYELQLVLKILEVKFKLKGERPSRETFSTMADDFLIKDISTLKKTIR
jgi:hypothetical protein